jgi:phosphoglycolate phosphatase
MAHIQHLKAVLFDLDDTLVATKEAKFAEHKLVAKKYYGITLTDDDIKRHWGISYDALVSELYQTKDVPQAMARIAKHQQDFPKIIFPETIDALSALKKRGVLIGIVTAHSRDGTLGDIDRIGISNLIDYVQGQECSTTHKPNPSVFDPSHRWLQVRGIEKDQVLYVGDGLHDMKAAVGFGYNFVGVENEK